MTIRFFILQTHYRSTLDFSNDALHAAEKGLKRLFEAYDILQNLQRTDDPSAIDIELNEKLRKLLFELDEFMSDDFNTAKVLANLFEIVPVINSLKDKRINAGALSAETFELLQKYFKDYLENILGLKAENLHEDGKLNGVVGLLIDIRREAKSKKDYATSDKIRVHLQELGILLKDEKDGSVSYTYE